MEKCCAKDGHISHGGGVLCPQYISLQVKSLMLDRWDAYKLNQARKLSYKICLSPLKTLVGVSTSGSAISETA